MEHIDGFLTGLPQHGTVAGVSALSTPPVLLGDRLQFACGSANMVHLIKFDEQGLFTGERIDVKVPSATVSALVYSPKFDRLYVGVEPAKK